MGETSSLKKMSVFFHFTNSVITTQDMLDLQRKYIGVVNLSFVFNVLFFPV